MAPGAIYAMLFCFAFGLQHIMLISAIFKYRQIYIYIAWWWLLLYSDGCYVCSNGAKFAEQISMYCTRGCIVNGNFPLSRVVQFQLQVKRCVLGQYP